MYVCAPCMQLGCILLHNVRWYFFSYLHAGVVPLSTKFGSRLAKLVGVQAIQPLAFPAVTIDLARMMNVHKETVLMANALKALAQE